MPYNLNKFKKLQNTITTQPKKKIDLNNWWRGGVNPLEHDIIEKGCGTAGCVAGYAIALFCPELYWAPQNYNPSKLARHALDLNHLDLQDLEYILANFNHGALFSSPTCKGKSDKQEALERLNICIKYIEELQNETK